MLVCVGAQLVTGQPVYLVFLHSIEHYLIAERDAVGWTIDGTFSSDRTEVIDANVDWVVGDQGEIGQDRIRHMDPSAEGFVNDQTVSAQLADAGSQARSLRVGHATQGVIP